uniref:Putative F-box/RNI/FBD-like domains-containing protein n=1 Tax=Davidia involucrata TaxID=16924 RepID=A0A5B7CCT0_DAVIN
MANAAESTTQQSIAVDSNSKRPKLSNENSKTIDRISTLPDSLLCHVLSFLPTKTVVGTSILSARWKFLWTCVPNLDFEDTIILNPKDPNQDEADKMSFVHFVYRVLVLCSAGCLGKFRVKCGQMDDMFHINTWVCAAIGRNVQELDLCIISDKQPMELPRSLLTCKTLVVLKLGHEIVISVPASGLVCFPNLKILHLISVKYANDDSVHKLFSSCPVLEDLLIKLIEADNELTFSICASALKRLTIETGGDDCKFEINAPALQYLNFKDHVFEDFSVQNLSSLVQANVYLSDIYDIDCVFSDIVFKLLEQPSNVKFLFLSGQTMEALSFSSDYNHPTFHNLKRLEVDVGCCDWHVLPKLLEGSDDLEVLVFSKGDMEDYPHESCWTQPQSVPKCLSLHLTTFVISGFEGCKDELKLVKYILKNAQVLKTMTINTRSPDLGAKFKLLQKISMFPRGSKTCQIAFS